MRSLAYIRMAFAVLFSFIAATFSSMMDDLLSSNLLYRTNVTTFKLPLLSHIYFHYSKLGYLMPIIAILLLLVAMKKYERAPIFFESVVLTLLLIAYAWSLGSVVAFVLPFTPIGRLVTA